jgi:predicted nucleic acid-binding protein
MAAADPGPVPGRVMLDTNVLLAATDEGRAEHGRALAVVNDWPGQGTTLYASGQILREYLAVATRPADRNGLGLSQADALTNVRAFRGRVSLLAEDGKVADRLLSLLDGIPAAGKQVHDANVVATMLVHGVDTVVTINLHDFARFGQLVRLAGL